LIRITEDLSCVLDRCNRMIKLYQILEPVHFGGYD
jgi:hypothetical protein